MFVILFFSIFLKLSHSFCPEGSTTIINPPGVNTKWKCINVSVFEKDFSSAEAECKNKKGHLVSIDNKAVDFFIARELSYFIFK